MRKVTDRSQIFPVFHDLFQRRRKQEKAGESRAMTATAGYLCRARAVLAGCRRRVLHHMPQQPPETARLFGLSMWQS
jgi:hypothetical protein